MGSSSLMSLSDSTIPDSIPGGGVDWAVLVSLRRLLLVFLLVVAVVVGRGLSPEVLLVVGRCCCRSCCATSMATRASRDDKAARSEATWLSRLWAGNDMALAGLKSWVVVELAYVRLV